jgi:hypothetical protein
VEGLLEAAEQAHKAHFIAENFEDILDFIITPKIIIFLCIIIPPIIICYVEDGQAVFNKISVTLTSFCLYSTVVSFIVLNVIDRQAVCSPSDDRQSDMIYAYFINLPFTFFLSLWKLYTITYIFMTLTIMFSNFTKVATAQSMAIRLALSTLGTMFLICLYVIILIASSYMYAYLACEAKV